MRSGERPGGDRCWIGDRGGDGGALHRPLSLSSPWRILADAASRAPVPAEETFQTAIAIAKGQGARGYALLASHSLAKLYQSTGRRGRSASRSSRPRSKAFRRRRKCLRLQRRRRCWGAWRRPYGAADRCSSHHGLFARSTGVEHSQLGRASELPLGVDLNDLPSRRRTAGVCVFRTTGIDVSARIAPTCRCACYSAPVRLPRPGAY